MHTNLWNSVSAEIRKGRNSFAVWLSLAGTLANLLLFAMLAVFELDQWAGSAHPWRIYVERHYAGIAFMMLPLYVIILASLVAYQEHRPGMWTQLWLLPVSRRDLYLGKIIYVFLLFVGAHLLYILGFLGSGLIVGLLAPESGLATHWPDGAQILFLARKTVVSIPGLLALQFWVSVRFRHFIVPLTIGILGFVLASLLGPGWDYAALLPYSPPILFMPEYLGQIALPSWQGWSLADGTSLAYGVLFTILGCLDFRTLQLRSG